MKLGVKSLVKGGAHACLSLTPDTVFEDHGPYPIRFCPVTMAHSLAHNPTPRSFYGEVVGDGMGGGAWERLDRRYMMVREMRIGPWIIHDPMVIEAMIPDLDNICVIPFLWTFELSGSMDSNELARRSDIFSATQHFAERTMSIEPFLSENFAIHGPGCGVEIVPVHAVSVEEFAELNVTFESPTP